MVCCRHASSSLYPCTCDCTGLGLLRSIIKWTCTHNAHTGLSALGSLFCLSFYEDSPISCKGGIFAWAWPRWLLLSRWSAGQLEGVQGTLVAMWSFPWHMLQTVRFWASSGCGAKTVANIKELYLHCRFMPPASCWRKWWLYAIQPDLPSSWANWMIICIYTTKLQVNLQSVLAAMNERKQYTHLSNACCRQQSCQLITLDTQLLTQLQISKIGKTIFSLRRLEAH